MSGQNLPTNLKPNGLTDSLSIFGLTAHQQQSYLNNQASMNTQQQRELQRLQSLLQQEPNQLKQSLMQSIPEAKVTRASHDLGGILPIISSIQPSTIASLPPDLQSQLLRSLANPKSSQSIDKLLPLVQKQIILDKARTVNEMDMKQILTRECEQFEQQGVKQNLQKHQISSSHRHDEVGGNTQQDPQSRPSRKRSRDSMGQSLQEKD